MAAYAAVVSLMNNIEQMMAHPHLSTSLDNNHIQPLVEKAGLLLDFIEGYNYRGVTSKEVEDLEKRITCAAHAAEDVIESHIVDQILAAEDGGSNGASLSCWLHLQQIVEDMDDILRKAIGVKEKEGLRLRLRLREEQPPHSHPTQHHMVGFQDELIQLMDELTNQRSNRHAISIVGMGGMGKTTLAQNLYTNPLINHHFHIRAWATVSQQYSVQDILSQLLSGLGTIDQSGEQLHRTLYGRRYLIVLDDLWSVEAWDAVRPFFPDNGNGSRVLLTTRLSNVAVECGSSCFTKKLLDDLFIMENLQTLKNAVNLRLSEEMSNIKKLHLVYDCEGPGYDDSLMECLGNLSRLHTLESLRLETPLEWCAMSDTTGSSPPRFIFCNQGRTMVSC